VKFRNYHGDASWHYNVNGIDYIKVGAYGIDDQEIWFDKKSKTWKLPKVGREYESKEEAYMSENRLWLLAEDSYKLNNA